MHTFNREREKVQHPDILVADGVFQSVRPVTILDFTDSSGRTKWAVRWKLVSSLSTLQQKTWSNKPWPDHCWIKNGNGLCGLAWSGKFSVEIWIRSHPIFCPWTTVYNYLKLFYQLRSSKNRSLQTTKTWQNITKTFQRYSDTQKKAQNFLILRKRSLPVYFDMFSS